MSVDMYSDERAELSVEQIPTYHIKVYSIVQSVCC